ncbi:hypothetical protein C7G42_07870 [Bradyrhizobium sp. MOS003]|nr:hypothetical protein C7G42_07870 [Bradyrhizobium sp. MOS003]
MPMSVFSDAPVKICIKVQAHSLYCSICARIAFCQIPIKFFRKVGRSRTSRLRAGQWILRRGRGSPDHAHTFNGLSLHLLLI